MCIYISDCCKTENLYPEKFKLQSCKSLNQIKSSICNNINFNEMASSKEIFRENQEIYVVRSQHLLLVLVTAITQMYYKIRCNLNI